jgi:DDE superfamily endonuclease
MTRSAKIRIFRQGASMLFYPAALPLSRQTLTYVSGIIRAQIGSPRRKLSPSQQALLVLAYQCKGDTFAELAAGFGIGTATAWRYVTETVGLLAARSPQREGQTGIAEGAQPRPRQAARPRRAGQRSAEDLAHPAQTPLLPLEGRAAHQGYPRPAIP